MSPELICEECQCPYPVWYAPNTVWNSVVRDDEGHESHAFLCPTCFTVLAEHLGMRPTAWVVAVEGSLETETTWRLKDGRPEPEDVDGPW